MSEVNLQSTEESEMNANVTKNVVVNNVTLRYDHRPIPKNNGVLDKRVLDNVGYELIIRSEGLADFAFPGLISGAWMKEFRTTFHCGEFVSSEYMIGGGMAGIANMLEGMCFYPTDNVAGGEAYAEGATQAMEEVVKSIRRVAQILGRAAEPMKWVMTGDDKTSFIIELNPVLPRARFITPTMSPRDMMLALAYYLCHRGIPTYQKEVVIGQHTWTLRGLMGQGGQTASNDIESIMRDAFSILIPQALYPEAYARGPVPLADKAVERVAKLLESKTIRDAEKAAAIILAELRK